VSKNELWRKKLSAKWGVTKTRREKVVKVGARNEGGGGRQNPLGFRRRRARRRLGEERTQEVFRKEDRVPETNGTG